MVKVSVKGEYRTRTGRWVFLDRPSKQIDAPSCVSNRVCSASANKINIRSKIVGCSGSTTSTCTSLCTRDWIEFMLSVSARHGRSRGPWRIPVTPLRLTTAAKQSAGATRAPVEPSFASSRQSPSSTDGSLTSCRLECSNAVYQRTE